MNKRRRWKAKRRRWLKRFWDRERTSTRVVGTPVMQTVQELLTGQPTTTEHHIFGELKVKDPEFHINWTGNQAGASIIEDVQAMIAALERDKQYGPYEFMVPDEYIREGGGDPNDYEEIAPGVRRVRAGR